MTDETEEAKDLALTGIPMSSPYAARSTQLIGVRDCNGWKIKVYQIVMPGGRVPEPVIDSAIEHIAQHAIWPEGQEDLYGFVILHTGESTLWILAKMWVGDILRQFIYAAPLSNPNEISDSPFPGYNECVWELEVTRYERDAWVRHVMATAQPDFNAYLADALLIEV